MTIVFFLKKGETRLGTAPSAVADANFERSQIKHGALQPMLQCPQVSMIKKRQQIKKEIIGALVMVIFECFL